MKTQFSFFIALGAALAPLTSERPAASAATAKAEVASRQYLVGTWHCTFTVGPQAGSYTTTWATALDNLWLTQTYDQAPSGDEPGFVAKYFIGYDERHMISGVSPMDELDEVVRAVSIPVQAVGGLSIRQAIECVSRGAPLVVVGAPLVIELKPLLSAL